MEIPEVPKNCINCDVLAHFVAGRIDTSEKRLRMRAYYDVFLRNV